MRIFTFECGTATLDPPKEFSKEQTVILLFDPEEPAPVCLLAGGSRHTAQGSLEPWDYATEIGPRAHDGNSYVWMAPSGPKLIRCILGFIRFMCLLSGLKGCVGLGPEWIIHLNGAAAITRVGSFTMSVPGFTSKLVEPWAVCHNPFRVDGLMCVMLGQFIRSTLNREEPQFKIQEDLCRRSKAGPPS